MLDEMDEELDGVSPNHRAGAIVIIDDGRNWTKWHVWNMRSRLRVNKGIYEEAPDRPLILKPKIQKKRGKHGLT
ncbi:hypothetical protein M976_02852 [Buttiauxella ferragutiae ATCC 51602]|uniref:Uncharacterized protein n=1 Tax=Buttiauxella ferragutiae ATCC 51602 TaxID=1354252 RepID=A0ABX2W6Z6_9ENTR|nr:hypothetical protein [Buttiauxella ferragutiae]OAT26691.1 hypothetical protein M976_02852 [Buttiauxella ferragutiae ATCC 51602]